MAGRLVIIRHAKAGEAPLDVHRPLTGRGRRDATAIGTWLASLDLRPDRVVVSPARRAQETWQAAAAALGKTPEPILDERIYDNTLDLLLDIVHETPDDVGTLVLVGHNPAFAALTYELDDERGDPEARRGLGHGFPTSATAVFDVPAWDELDSGNASLAAFAVPRG